MKKHSKVGDICNREVVFAHEDMSLKEAAKLMRGEHVGSLVVVREATHGKIVVGMVTDRDITVMGVARDFDPQSLRVADIMSSDPVTVRPDDSVNEVLGEMRSRGTRRIPVTTDDGVLVGIVALDDSLDVMADEMRAFVQAIESAQKREVRTRG